MARIDEIKGEINYAKVWLGILVLTNISLISWLINNYETSVELKIYADIIAIFLLTIFISLVHKSIKRKILSLKDI